MGSVATNLSFYSSHVSRRSPIEGEWIPASARIADSRSADDLDDGRDLPVVVVTVGASRSSALPVNSGRSLSPVEIYQQVMNLGTERPVGYSARA